jgi:catechol 2,3-dioxygenase-like lactoylglutathione lyase family enzyme
MNSDPDRLNRVLKTRIKQKIGGNRMSLKLDHVGHVVNNIAEARKLYEEQLGLVPRIAMDHPVFGARMIFYPFANIEIELIQPSNIPDDFARRCLNERGEGIFHLSFVPDNYDAEVKALREKGFAVEEIIIDEPTRKPARLAFLKPEETHGLWIELVDSNK